MMQRAILGLAKNVLAADERDENDLCRFTLESAQGGDDKSTPFDTDVDLSLIASGGYNDVWLARNLASPGPEKHRPDSVVIRVPKGEGLQPHQVGNEVGWLLYLSTHHPKIPVPRVYAYSDGDTAGTRAFIVEQYIDGPPLSNTWMSFSEDEKETIAKQVAEIIVQLGEIRFDRIAGMTPSGELGPTVEGNKLFKGRSTFHNSACYDIGPYRTVKEYILAMYDKEIFFYQYADDSCFDDDDFAEISRTDFVQSLKDKQITVKAELAHSLINEPFVLCHGDLHGRNILMDGKNIVGIIDCELANSFPLSELASDGVEVLEMVDDESEEECFKWCGRIGELVKDIAAQRQWKDDELALLAGSGNVVLQTVRVEMLPTDLS